MRLTSPLELSCISGKALKQEKIETFRSLAHIPAPQSALAAPPLRTAPSIAVYAVPAAVARAGIRPPPLRPRFAKAINASLAGPIPAPVDTPPSAADENFRST